MPHEQCPARACTFPTDLATAKSQARYFLGRIDKDGEDGYSFVKKKDTTAKLVVQHLDSLNERGLYPSLDDLERAHFGCNALGDLTEWSPDPSMIWDEASVEANPDTNPTTSAFQINLLRGGMVFGVHVHHWACDLQGWHNFMTQLAENCYAVAKNTSLPPWDPACIDVSRFCRKVDSWVEGPPAAKRHTSHPDEQQALLFHVPKSKAAELKKMASSGNPHEWISTYDAMTAYLWRQLSRARTKLYQPDWTTPVFFGQAVNMRPRLENPRVPDRMMRNVLCGAFGDTAPVTQPNIAQVLGKDDYPLSKLAYYVRQLTNSCTPEHMEDLIDMIAPIRDKRSISLRVDALPPMSLWVTDHRSGDVGGLDFGFGQPITYRHLWGEHITPGLALIYAPIHSSSNPDEGCTFSVTVEEELVPKLLEDPDWTEYFEFRGLD